MKKICGLSFESSIILVSYISVSHIITSSNVHLLLSNIPNFNLFVSSSTYAILAQFFEVKVVETLLPTLLDVLSSATFSALVPSACVSHSILKTDNGINSSTYSKLSPISPASSPVAPVFPKPVLPSSPVPQHLTCALFSNEQLKPLPD